MSTLKIAVTTEGREGVYLPDRDSLKAWIEAQEFEAIHNFVATGAMMLGADHSVESVLADIDKAERVGVLTGASQAGNFGHALALVLKDGRGERLEMYDIGPVTDDDLDVREAVQS